MPWLGGFYESHTGIRCECHDCTQARWKQSFQYQLEQVFLRPTEAQADPLPKENE